MTQEEIAAMGKTGAPIGLKFKPLSKRGDIEYTIIDILKTFNSKNELVKTEYLCTHELCGQIVTSRECIVTIQRGLWQEFVNKK